MVAMEEDMVDMVDMEVVAMEDMEVIKETIL